MESAMTGVIITTLGGLGMFILGMKMMTEGLQMSAGKRIKSILSAVSSNRAVGCLTGAFVTAMVQSSSATTVMLIGFVTAGLMSLQQAVGMILGANVGTTVTAQLIAFKLTELALPAIATGVVLKYFTQQKKTRYIGEVLLGFGLLFYGMTVMKLGLAPIKSDPTFLAFFTKFDPSTLSGLLLSVFVGASLTIMVQSSSATIGLTMTLASQGLLTFPGAMALVLGENIGTTITAELATLGSNNINAHRAARAHTMFNVLGVGLMLCVFPWFIQFVGMFTQALGSGPVDQVVGDDMINVARYIANGHTLFNIINASFFLLVLPWLIKVAIMLSPKEEEDIDYYRLPNFGDRLIDTPIAAIVEARSEILRMAETAKYTFSKTVKRLKDRDYKKLAKWRQVENHLDDMQRDIVAYLTRIYQSGVSESEAKELSSLMRMTNNIERIGDSVENIAQAIEDMIENNLTFTEQAMADMYKLVDKVAAFIDLISSAMRQRPANFMNQADSLENAIDAMREKYRDDHIQRLRSCECGIEQGLVYVNLLTNLEKIGDYCLNIAEAVAGKK
jgi:phosphate:Na+ symporter